MGQTLTYGVYLPDEGERNCYSGLAQNWQILDDAVGAIAGKANASHTHGNITNDGAIGSTSGLPVITGTDGVLTTGTFGSTEGTFCEGNDSRLSDARTPVAHTHGKSDITDLLNSNFIPSANNSYDLGSSSYQWNNLYAKNYYYNGTQWGLDQANVWTAMQTFTARPIFAQSTDNAEITFRNLNFDPVTSGQSSVSSTYTTSFVARNSSNGTIGALSFIGISSLTLTRLTARYYTAASTYSEEYVQLVYNGSTCQFSPGTTNTTDLGTSTNKWKTLNGVNPGALSLPNTSSGDPIDKTNWDLTGATSNAYTATEDGWVSIGVRFNHLTYVSVLVGITGGDDYAEQTMVPNPAGTGVPRYHFLCVPVRAGQTVRVTAICSLITFANFYPCQGNV